jgi:MFS family permease
LAWWKRRSPSDQQSASIYVLQHRDYRLLFFATIITSLGTQIQRTALSWQIFDLTGDPVYLGYIGLARFIPLMLFGLVGGLFADRGDRRHTLIATQLLLVGLSGSMALLSDRGLMTPVIIYGFTALTATVTAVANPTRQALIPALVPRSDLAGAMSLNILAAEMAMIVGPAVAGFIIAWRGPGIAYGLDAVSFVAVIVAILLMRARPAVEVQTQGGAAAIAEGLRFLGKSPILLGVMGVDFLATLFGAATVLMPIFAEEVFAIGPEGLGILLSAPAAGAVFGSLALGLRPVPKRPGAVVLAAVLIYGACILGFGLSPNIYLALAFLAGSGAADAVSTALRATLRNLVSPDALRVRIAAAHSMLAMGGPQLGEFESGVVASFVGPRGAVTIGGIGIISTVLLAQRLVPAVAAYRLPTEPLLTASGAEPAATATARTQPTQPASSD